MLEAGNAVFNTDILQLGIKIESLHCEGGAASPPPSRV
jgi:hypothetical protein